jgi:hypothetical protein
VNRALIPISPLVDEPAGFGGRSGPSADFVVHLIATREQLPQTRLRRRAEPEAATAAYAALGHWPIRLGRSLSRFL